MFICSKKFESNLQKTGTLVKLGPTDLQMLKDAEEILFDEFSLSFKIAREDVGSFVKKLLN